MSPERFDLVVRGSLDPTLVEETREFEITRIEDGCTHLVGEVSDPSFLYILLESLRVMNIPLVSLSPLGGVQADSEGYRKTQLPDARRRVRILEVVDRHTQMELLSEIARGIPADQSKILSSIEIDHMRDVLTCEVAELKARQSEIVMSWDPQTAPHSKRRRGLLRRRLHFGS
jgi:hypothetical protein